MKTHCAPVRKEKIKSKKTKQTTRREHSNMTRSTNTLETTSNTIQGTNSNKDKATLYNTLIPHTTDRERRTQQQHTL